MGDFWLATALHMFIAVAFFGGARDISAIQSDFINVKIPRLLCIILVREGDRNGRKTIPLVGIFLYIGIFIALCFSIMDMVIRIPSFPQELADRLLYIRVEGIPWGIYAIFFITGFIYAHICEFYCKFRRNNKGED